VKLPAPSAGTAEQPAPKGAFGAAAAVLSALWLALLAGLEDALLPDEPSEPQAVSVMARLETAARRTPRA
jgi:hypothetical protein